MRSASIFCCPLRGELADFLDFLLLCEVPLFEVCFLGCFAELECAECVLVFGFEALVVFELGFFLLFPEGLVCAEQRTHAKSSAQPRPTNRRIDAGTRPNFHLEQVSAYCDPHPGLALYTKSRVKVPSIIFDAGTPLPVSNGWG